MSPGLVPLLGCRLQISVIWLYEKVLYYIESFRRGKRLWIVLKHKSSSKSTSEFSFRSYFLWMGKRKLNKDVWERKSFIYTLKNINTLMHNVPKWSVNAARFLSVSDHFGTLCIKGLKQPFNVINFCVCIFS